VTGDKELGKKQRHGFQARDEQSSENLAKQSNFSAPQRNPQAVLTNYFTADHSSLITRH